MTRAFELSESRRLEYLSLALHQSNIGVIVQDEHKQFELVFNLPDDWNSQSESGASDKTIFGYPLASKLERAKDEALSSGKRQIVVTAVDDRVMSFDIERFQTAEDARHVITTLQDITEIRRRENTLRALLLEFSHRSKNLLSIIQSIAVHSAKQESSLDYFIKSFMGRLFAISGSQDLMVDSSWQGASLFELVKTQLAIVAGHRNTKISLEGVDVQLTSNQALHIGLALHELALQALSQRAVVENPKELILRAELSTGVPGINKITWRQTPGRMPENENDTEFGAMLLSRIVPAAVSGTVRKKINAPYFEWSLSFPADAKVSLPENVG